MKTICSSKKWRSPRRRSIPLNQRTSLWGTKTSQEVSTLITLVKGTNEPIGDEGWEIILNSWSEDEICREKMTNNKLLLRNRTLLQEERVFVSIAHSSATMLVAEQIKEEKPRCLLPRKSRKMSPERPQPAFPEFPGELPSTLTFRQPYEGGCHRIQLMVGAELGFKIRENAIFNHQSSSWSKPQLSLPSHGCEVSRRGISLLKYYFNIIV